MNNKLLITAALPYANGRVHLGHLAGAYLPADTFARWKRLKGVEVVFICGSDEHGIPITLSALKRGGTPQDVVDEFHPANGNAFKAARVDFDYWGRTSHPEHHKLSQEFFSRLLEKGYIDRRETRQYYSEQSNMFLPDRYVVGTCPHCGNVEARGDECEQCARPYEVTELVKPRCNLPGDSSTPSVKSTEHFFLKLDCFKEPLEQWIHSKNGKWRLNALRGAESWLTGLRARCITRDTTWGVSVPLAEQALEGKRMYVWFDAPIGYVTFTKQLFAQRGQLEGWKDFWQNESCPIYNFIGKDNIPFHAIIWPAMQLGVNESVPAGERPYQLVTQVSANEFLNFRNENTGTDEKASKTKGNAIEIEDFVKQYGSDALRYYLTAIAPEESDSAFSLVDFKQRYNKDLADVVGNFAHRSATFTIKYFEGKIPEGAPPGPLEDALRAEMAAAIKDTAAYLDACKFKFALARILELGRASNKYFDEKAPWALRKTDLNACGTALRLSLEAYAAQALLLRPFLPDASVRALALFGLDAQAAMASGSANLDPTQLAAPGKVLGIPEVLFKKIEDEPAAGGAPAKAPKPAKPPKPPKQ